MDIAKSELCYYKQIIIQGIVQGVGFRPFVFRLAQKHGIRGNVKNISGVVCITACGLPDDIEQFINDIEANAHQPMHIEHISLNNIEPFYAYDFKIIESHEDNQTENRFLPPDHAICGNCLKEIENNSDRRFRHAFNSCISCGPRFSIINHLPYDRVNTTMVEMKMCAACEKEYTDFQDRRFHAETICCSDCKPVIIYSTESEELTGERGLRHAIEALKQGGIIAIKGIGGYHFACSPFNHKAVQALRRIKQRDKKPFAIMFKNLIEVEKVCYINDKEISVLQSCESPITLLEIKNGIFTYEVLFDEFRCGCFLPYTALHHLLMQELGMLVMTSANISGSAIVYDDEEMLVFFQDNQNEFFSGVLYHERKIVRSMEDSVVQVIMEEQLQVIRRSRGYVPMPFYLENNKSFLALGGDLKASFCLVKNKFAYMSQYLGDLEKKDSYDLFREAISDYQNLFAIEPEFVICDAHPSYMTSKLALEMNLPIVKIQHHHAHIASVMAEHSIKEKVIGVAFDGTGYGDDGCIWGGEFLICDGGTYRRAAQLNYIKMIGGDDLAIDAKKTASCIILQEEFDDRTPIIKAALDNDVNVIHSSSMGRLFDAVSAVLGICDYNGYEGECAISLQRFAEEGLKDHVAPYIMHFDISEKDGMLFFDGEKIVKLIYKEYTIDKKATKQAIALGFHIACSEVIKNICVILRDREKTNAVVLSGGVFQNQLLTEHAIRELEKNNFKVFINQSIPPNDGGISLGQAFIGSLIGALNDVYSSSCKSDYN